MEPPKSDPPKLPNMVVFPSMCGDHPSITKTELNAKEEKPGDKLERDKDRLPQSHTRISPTASRAERARPAPEQAPRLIEARRHVRMLEAASRQDDINAPANRALLQAALGSFRWPPYLVAVWVLVLLLTHVLHCLVTMLERALPAIKKFCVYFRTWTEEWWRGGGGGGGGGGAAGPRRAAPLALASVTGLLYGAYFGLYAVYAVALWAVEPLAPDDAREDETNVTDYGDDLGADLNSTLGK